VRITAGFLLALPLLAAPPFTIEQVLSASFPSDLVASPKGDAVAWVLNAQGVRNVWAAHAPDFRAAPLTKFAADDGQELGGIAWKHDGTAVVFTRGGDPNAHAEFPNPRSNPSGVQQEIWIASFAGAPRKLGDGQGAVISPDDATVAWVVNNQIWSMPLKGGLAAQLIRARGTAREPVWSPDGTHLAFISDRGDHAFIGVYDVRDKSLRFLDPSVDTDQSPVWSPDSRQIAFIRTPAEPDAFPWGAKRTGPPWSIRVADAHSGAGREIWRALEGTGSVFWPMSAPAQLLWSARGIVFPWERDGWLHLYVVAATDVVPSTGGGAVPLTPGNFEIENAALTADGRAVVYSSNRDNIDRRHLWRVNLEGSSLVRLTAGGGIEWGPAPLTNGRIAILHADAKMPARVALLDDALTIRDLVPSAIPSEFPADALIAPQPVIFQASDGVSIHSQLFVPANGGAGKHPAVIFFHGGSRRQMLLGWHYMEYYHQAYGFNQYLASKGYVVLSVNYRSGIGYGTDFREAPGYGPTGASEFGDVIAAGAYLRGRADVDSAQIGVWGGSYGGYLTALALARASDTFAAGVDIAGIHDWNLEWAGKPDGDYARVAFESSPLAHVSTWRSPILLIQGDDDRNVAFGNSVRLAEALRARGVPFEQMILPDEVHEFLLHSDWLAVYHAADRFLERYLKP
jgi:dipeptidyl aminopeptidase/acylaminoacyl peptidase